MLTVKHAIERMKAAPRPGLPVEELSLFAALGRVLAQDQIALIDVPPAANSAMDGYAFRHADVAGKAQRVVEISQRIAAGHSPVGLTPGTAARIFTGAEIPAGADTVAMQEDCDAADDKVSIRELPEAGANIRARAQDIAAGRLLLPRGHRLRAQDLGLLASQGLDRVKVYQRLKVALLSTGDELAEPGQPLAPGQIYNSNRYTMSGLLQGWGFEVIDLAVAPDQPDAIRALFAKAAERADVIVSSGGVSVGEEDHVKSIVEEIGSLDLWRIAIKPGKPFAFGNILGKPFLGLPGNPVSVFVTLLIIARPFLLACQGMHSTAVQPSQGIAAFSKPGSSREDYLRVRVTAAGLDLFPSQSSGVLLSTSESDGLVRQPLGEDIKNGDSVDYFPYPLFS
jgi:molybdopterin molybdotransferase